MTTATDNELIMISESNSNQTHLSVWLDQLYFLKSLWLINENNETNQSKQLNEMRQNIPRCNFKILTFAPIKIQL